MILSHEDGQNAVSSLKRLYDLKIKCLYLDSNFIPKTSLDLLLQRYLKLAEDFPKITILRKSDNFSESAPSFEMDFFCNREDLEKFTIILDDRGIDIDEVQSNLA